MYKWLITALAALLVATGCSDGVETADPSTNTPAQTCGTDVEEETALKLQAAKDTTDLTGQQRDRIDLYRGLLVDLGNPNPTTCEGLVVATPTTDAASVGAFEGHSFTSQDPAVRYDAYLYPSRQAAAEANAQQGIEDASPSDTTLVYSIGGALFIAVSSDASEDAAAITQHYDAYLQGVE